MPSTLTVVLLFLIGTQTFRCALPRHIASYCCAPSAGSSCVLLNRRENSKTGSPPRFARTTVSGGFSRQLRSRCRPPRFCFEKRERLLIGLSRAEALESLPERA